MFVWLSTVAMALPPEVGAAGLAEFVNGEGPDTGGYGAGLVASTWVTPWLAVDGHVQLVAAKEAVQVSFFPEVRLRVTGGDPHRGALGLAAGFGARFPSDVLARGTLAAVADIPASARLLVRPEVRYLFSDLASPGAGQFAVGLVWRAKEAVTPVVEPAPVVAPPPVVAEPAPAAIPVDPPDARVWLPHPICQWVPAAELGQWVPQLRPEDRLRFQAQGHLPVELEAGALGAVTLPAAPPQGSLLVVAEPGDTLELGGQTVRMGPDGVALLSVPEGAVSGTVVGGGRAAPFEVAVGTGFAVWVRVPEPRSIRFDFPRGSAELSVEDRARVAEAVRHAGGWMFIVQGSASPDGPSGNNPKIAADRAQAVVEALFAAGMPANRVVVRPSIVAEDSADPLAARYAVILPVPLGGGF